MEDASVSFSDAADPRADASSAMDATEDGGALDTMSSDGAATSDSGPSVDISLVDPPDGWVQTPTRCGVRFWGPPDMVEIAAQGIDSCVFRFRTANCDIGGDSGGFSDRLMQDEGELDFDAKMVRIDGREGKLVQYRRSEGGSEPYVVAMRVPLPSPPRWQLAATLHAVCPSVATREEALLSIRTATIRAESDGATNSDGGVMDPSVPSAGFKPIPILIGESSNVSVTAGEVFTILVKFLGENGMLEPEISSPIVRFLGVDPTPSGLQTPGGPVRLFRFQATDVGSAELSFPRAAWGDAGPSAQRVVTVHVQRP